jgi:hypothetical protein
MALHVVCGTKCCATDLLNYSMINGFCDCAKCAELEIQLQQVREELSSIKLIIQLLNKVRVQGMTVTTPIQTMETKWEVDKGWEVITPKGAKKRPEGNGNLRKKGLLNFRGQAIVTTKHFAALEDYSHLFRDEDGMETIYKNTISTINKDQEEKMKHIVQNYSSTSTSLETLDPESKVEHNLQSHSLTHKKHKKRDLQHTNHNKWPAIERRYKLDYAVKDTTTGKKESKYYEENCKVGV